MHWQIGKGGGYHYAVAEGARPESAGHGVPRRAAGADPLRDRAAARERARADARVAHRRPPAAAGARPRPASADRRRGVRAASARCRRGCGGPRARSAITTATTRCSTTTRCSRSSGWRTGTDAIFPATVVGKPRQEDFFIGDLLQELLSPLFPLVMPAVEQLWSYGETGYHSLAAAVVKQRYKREAMASAFRILGEGQLSLTKFLLVTDRHVDVQELPRDARAHPRADARRDRSLRVLEPLDGHARLHRARRSTRVRRACGSGSAIRCASCRGSSAVRAVRRDRRPRVLRRLPRRDRAERTHPSRMRRRGWRRRRRLPAVDGSLNEFRLRLAGRSP